MQLRFGITAIVLILLRSNFLVAQNESRPQGTQNPLTIQQLVAPSFKVSPLVIQAESRRGKVVPLEYVMESSGRPTRVRLSIVSLRQEETGVIMPDEAAVPPGVITFDGPTEFILNPNEPKKITGEIRIPAAETSFLSCGLLVKDLGVDQENPAADANGEARVRLKFVTQYLCRADITVLGTRGGDVSRLQVESGKLVASGGLPQACIYVTNPTDSPLEFESRCRLMPAGGKSRRSYVPMVMPARTTSEGEKRYIGRVLPKSRVRVEALLPNPVFSGEYELQTEIVSRGRPVFQNSQMISVEDGAFPAISVSIAKLAPGVYASPAQLEVSMQRGGDRIRNITLKNENDQPVTVQVHPVDAEGNPIQWLTVRPSVITLNPDSERKVAVTQATSVDVSGNLYGVLALQVSDENNAIVSGSGRIAVAMVGRSAEPAELNIVDMRFDANAKYPSFVVNVRNSGDVHSPLNGRVTLMSESGQQIEIPSGFGRWLMPGESAEMVFPVQTPPPNGSYQLQTEIHFSDVRPVLSRTDRVELFFTRTAANDQSLPK